VPGAAQLGAAVLQRLSSVRLGTSAVALAFAWALVNWGADALCLAAAIAAARVAVPWSRLLLAWSAGSAAESFSPTPFGLGVVDVALIAASGLVIGSWQAASGSPEQFQVRVQDAGA
jgi:uncharacterized membrane protein YbhN (UPF0104 family)